MATAICCNSNESDCAYWELLHDESVMTFQDKLTVVGDGVIVGRDGTILTFGFEPNSTILNFQERVVDIVGDAVDVYANGVETVNFVVVGSAGMLYTSSNLVDWKQPVVANAQLDTGDHLRAVDFGCDETERYQNNYGIIVGDGIILRTEDYGMTWQRVDVNISVSLVDVEVMGDGRTALAAGGAEIFRTDDYGVTWTAVPPVVGIGGQLLWLSSTACKIPYTEPAKIIVAGGNVSEGMLVSSNLGKTWQVVSPPPGVMSLSSLLIISEDESGLRSARGISGDELWEFHKDESSPWWRSHVFEAPIQSSFWKEELFLNIDGGIEQHKFSEDCSPR